MKGNMTPLYIIGGLGLVYLIMKNSPTALAAQSAALTSAAALQSQAVSTQANEAYATDASNLVNSLASDFSS